eukprot:gene42816-47503_t
MLARAMVEPGAAAEAEWGEPPNAALMLRALKPRGVTADVDGLRRIVGADDADLPLDDSPIDVPLRFLSVQMGDKPEPFRLIRPLARSLKELRLT